MKPLHQRKQRIQQLSSKQFDLLVIGGGITGAGVALDAASRGLSVALIEKKDFASGTSSKSTKLIHGGLRYLKNLELKLVRETGSERAIVHKLAPHLVRPEKMLLPIIKGGALGKYSSSIALWVYDFLANVDKSDKRKMLNKIETLAKEPLLRQDILQGGGYYAEYRTDDARLTIENLKTATNYDAIVCNYIEAIDFNYDQDGHISSINCIDHINNKTLVVNSRHVISTTGPWVDELRRADQSITQTAVFWSKGVHIVIDKDKLPLKQATYFDTPYGDNRMIFAIPRQRSVYIGTTDTPHEGSPDRITITLEDVNYLLGATNAMFPDANLQTSDIESSWAGIRPLILEEGKEGKEMSRKDEIFESQTGLLSIAGGKLTGYRKMAQRVVDRLAKQLQAEERKIPKSTTQNIPLIGGMFDNYQAVLQYEQLIARKLQSSSLDASIATYLVANYGRQSETIVERAKGREEIPHAARLAAAEAQWTIEYEQAMYPLDFLERRSGRLYFDMPNIHSILDAVIDVFSDSFEYSPKQHQKERNKVIQEIRSISQFQ